MGPLRSVFFFNKLHAKYRSPTQAFANGKKIPRVTRPAKGAPTIPNMPIAIVSTRSPINSAMNANAIVSNPKKIAENQFNNCYIITTTIIYLFCFTTIPDPPCDLWKIMVYKYKFKLCKQYGSMTCQISIYALQDITK